MACCSLICALLTSGVIFAVIKQVHPKQHSEPTPSALPTVAEIEAMSPEQTLAFKDAHPHLFT